MKKLGALVLALAFASGALADDSSIRNTFIASASGLTTTSAFGLAVESTASKGFRVAEVCVGVTNATAAAGATVTLRRTTAASSGGTTATAEGTGAIVVSKMDPEVSNYGGVARAGAITTTAGATLDQWGFQVGEIGAGAADPAGNPIFCHKYGGDSRARMPTAAVGTANGIAVSVSSLGAGGLAFGSISVTFLVD